jgi:hypothetical protein
MWLKLRWRQLVRNWLRDVWVSRLRQRVRIVLHELLLPHLLLALVRRQAVNHQAACQVDRADVPPAFDVIRRDAAPGGFAKANFRITHAAGGFAKSESDAAQRRSSRSKPAGALGARTATAVDLARFQRSFQ